MNSSLPEALTRERENHPFDDVAYRARGRLVSLVPALAKHTAELPVTVFGLSGGFFYLTSAQGRAWGMDERHVAEVLTVQALGHCHFAFHDLVLDEGDAPAVMCLLSDACLGGYFKGLSALAAGAPERYLELHWRYYNLYAAAIDRDLTHRETLSAYSTEDILGLGDKAAPGATMIHLVAELAGRTECAEAASLALLRLCTGLQLVDDLNDAGKDASVKNRTWPVTSALLAYPHVDITNADAVEAAVVGSGAAAGCLRLAGQAFTHAQALAVDAEALVLANLAGSWRATTERRLDRLQQALENL